FGVDRHRIDVVAHTPPRSVAERAAGVPRSPAGPLELIALDEGDPVCGLDTMLCAVLRLRGRANARLTIVAQGEAVANIRARVAGAGLGEREVNVCANVPSGAVHAIVCGARLDSVPQPLENGDSAGRRTTVFDYMAAGLAVIASDASANAHIVRTTGAGEVFRAGDAAALACAIERMADPQCCDAAGRAAQRAILDRYHWEQDSAALARSVSVVARPRSRAAARSLPLPST